ncbi:transporter substrate-binding domain-containing protein [Paraburkholderia acidisoli]|uniref:Transporter substrate-binding domain-containing protein n=1 Tax=Paraburkholderia acidisoli TaxID=2571748 RepID=A0A7Z2JGN2_9BURK|nr:transporter substrate-binding domain-containing protein [Paraburkholderia acidisoli]QGZ63921.1 transporter substrate-binding domain-containing protein [Paraburkholderia acidisoli]
MRALVAAILSAGALACAHADELDSPTLRKIRDTGTIVIGVREAAVPFSYRADGEHATGYSYEIAQRIAATVRDALKLPALRVRELSVTAQNRITLVQNGTVDLECSTASHTRERENDVAFSDSIFEYGVRMLVRRGSPVKDFADLAGRTVVTTAGTSEERRLRRWNVERGMDMRILAARSHADSFEAVRADRAVAFVMDAPLLHAALATGYVAGDAPGQPVARSARAVSDAREFEIVGTPATYEVYGCMFRRGDAAFKRLADTTIANMQRSGEALALYHRWFESPIPPAGVNLDYPLSPQMKALFANPNDRPLD